MLVMTATDRPDVFFAPPDPPCRHCAKRKANRPRGLCWGCYYNPEVNPLYPTASKHGRRGLANGNVSARPLPTPTAAWPGSAEKVAALCERAERGLSLWHPEDARACSSDG